MEILVPHGLERAEAVRRILETGRRNDIEFSAGSGEYSGVASKVTALGSVCIAWEVRETEVLVRLLEKPAWLPEGSVRRPIEEALIAVLSA